MKAIHNHLKYTPAESRTDTALQVHTRFTGHLAIHGLDAIHVVRVPDVFRVEADGNYCVLHMRDGRTLTVSKTLKTVSEAINSNYFIRVHASHLIQLLSIRELERDQIVMDDGTIVPVSRRRRPEIIEALSSIAASI